MQIEKNNFRFHIPSTNETLQNINIQTKNSQNITLDVKLKRFEKDIEEWKGLLLFLDAVFQGTKPLCFGLIVALNTLFFGLVWYYEPNFLQIISIIGLIILTIDILFVKMISFCPFFSVDDHNKRYQFICSLLYFYLMKIEILFRQILHFRLNNALMFYSTAVPVMFVLYWISTKISFLLLLFSIINLLMFTSILRLSCLLGLIATFIAAALIKLKCYCGKSKNPEPKQD